MVHVCGSLSWINPVSYKCYDTSNINIFESNGLKIIKVLDRALHLKDQNTKIVDKIGHYMFDLDFYDDYGTRPNSPLMAELEVKFDS